MYLHLSPLFAQLDKYRMEPHLHQLDRSNLHRQMHNLHYYRLDCTGHSSGDLASSQVNIGKNYCLWSLIIGGKLVTVVKVFGVEPGQFEAPDSFKVSVT